MTWSPRPEDFIFNRVLRARFRRGWLCGFFAGQLAMWSFLFALHLAGVL